VLSRPRGALVLYIFERRRSLPLPKRCEVRGNLSSPFNPPSRRTWAFSLIIILYLFVENPFLHDESSCEGSGGDDHWLQPVGQHSALPLGVQPSRGQVRVETRLRSAVGGPVMDHRDGRFPLGSAGHTDCQRAGDA